MRIALIADIHEDVVSLEKALRMIEREKCDQIVCLGDIVGYPYQRAKYESTRNASACIALIQKNCNFVVAGNHDLFHVQRIPKYAGGFKFPANWYSFSPEQKLDYSNNKVWNYTDDYPVLLNEQEVDYLKNLPEFSVLVLFERRLLISHFVYPNFTGSVCSYRGDGKRITDHFNFLDNHQCQLSVCGHMHVEGLGLYYRPDNHFIAQLFKGFDYYSFGERRIKDKICAISIPALADNGQVNGLAILDTKSYTINAMSLNTHRRFIL